MSNTQTQERPTKTCTVGCKLPQGLIMEVGYKVVPGGISRNSRDGYKKVVLKGANQHSQVVGTLRSPSPANLQPGITNNVDEDVFDRWMKEHADTNIVRNGLVFKEVNVVEATAHAADIVQQKTGMEALDASKAHGIEKLKLED